MKKIIVTGHVGRDPELRVDQTGGEFAAFSVGVSVGTKQNPKTDWVDVSCNGKLAEIARNYVRKGSKVLIEGFPGVNAYLSRDNKPVGTLKIYANTIELLSRKDDNDTNNQYRNNDKATYDLPPIEENIPVGALQSDDIPF